MRAVNAEQVDHGNDFPKGQSHRVQAHPEHPDGCRGALVLPHIFTIHLSRLFEQVCECHDHYSLRPARFSNSLN